MTLGVVGKKIGMTRVFTENGEAEPVTVLKVDEMSVSQIKTADRDGYSAVQLAIGSQHPARLNKCQAGHLAKAGVEPSYRLEEFNIDEQQLGEFELGQSVTLELMSDVDKVDVTATTKGKGFAGTVKRYGFNEQPATHGVANVHRKTGSIGQCQTPGRVFKNKKMPGQMGDRQCTKQNLKLIKIDNEKNVILVKGACPGSKGSYVRVTPAVKAKRSQ